MLNLPREEKTAKSWVIHGFLEIRRFYFLELRIEIFKIRYIFFNALSFGPIVVIYYLKGFLTSLSLMDMAAIFVQEVKNH